MQYKVKKGLPDCHVHNKNSHSFLSWKQKSQCYIEARFPSLSRVWSTLPEKSSGEGRGLLSRTAAGNQAYIIFLSWQLFVFISLVIQKYSKLLLTDTIVSSSSFLFQLFTHFVSRRKLRLHIHHQPLFLFDIARV